MAGDQKNASKLIDERIKELGDWRGKTLGKLRGIIKKADPGVAEEWKWVKATSPGTAVWAHNGGICTGEVYKNVVKLTFFKGAALPDPAGLFNSSLDGKVRRAIDVKENETIDEAALANLIRGGGRSQSREQVRPAPRERLSDRAARDGVVALDASWIGAVRDRRIAPDGGGRGSQHVGGAEQSPATRTDRGNGFVRSEIAGEVVEALRAHAGSVPDGLAVGASGPVHERAATGLDLGQV